MVANFIMSADTGQQLQHFSETVLLEKPEPSTRFTIVLRPPKGLRVVGTATKKRTRIYGKDVSNDEPMYLKEHQHLYEEDERESGPKKLTIK